MHQWKCFLSHPLIPLSCELVHDFYSWSADAVLWLKESLFTRLWTGVDDDLRGIDAVSPPTQNADGFLRGGMNEWFLWQQLYNLNMWRRGLGERKRLQRGLLCNKQSLRPPIYQIPPRAAAKYTCMNSEFTGPKKHDDICLCHADTFKNSERVRNWL